MGTSDVASAAANVWYAYAIVRLVPRVERGECVNVGVVLFAREWPYLAARIELDVERLRALAPEADLDLIERHLRTFVAVGEGADAGGPLAALPPSERFHWLTAPRSTVIQTSPVHVGICIDPAATLDELLDEFVRPPRTGAAHSSTRSVSGTDPIRRSRPGIQDTQGQPEHER